MAVFTGAPAKGERARDDDTAKDRVRRALDKFERSVDLRFFDDLNAELDLLDDGEKAREERGRWLIKLHRLGKEALEAAISSAPDAAMRHWRVRVRARDVFDYGFKKHFRDTERVAEGLWKKRAGQTPDQSAQGAAATGSDYFEGDEHDA